MNLDNDKNIYNIIYLKRILTYLQWDCLLNLGSEQPDQEKKNQLAKHRHTEC
jgi:hypothetical protein